MTAPGSYGVAALPRVRVGAAQAGVALAAAFFALVCLAALASGLFAHGPDQVNPSTSRPSWLVPSGWPAIGPRSARASRAPPGACWRRWAAAFYDRCRAEP